MKAIERFISYPAFNLTSLLTRDDEFDNDDFSICKKKRLSENSLLTYHAMCALIKDQQHADKIIATHTVHIRGHSAPK